MQAIKIVLVSVFCLLAAAPLISSRVSPLTGALAKATTGGEKKPAPPVDPSRYVGSDSCAQCHQDQSSHFAVTAHRKTLVGQTAVDLRGCEACHGPAKEHVDFHRLGQELTKAGKEGEANALYGDDAKAAVAKLNDFIGLTPTKASAVCLKCHEGSQGRSEERINFRRSEHARHGVSCLDCHSSHSPKRTEFLLRAAEPESCYACHADQKSSFARPFHHKVPEGAMKCSDCHNPHGSFQNKQLRSWVGSDVACTKCHADKAGPFVFEHAPVKIEGCQTCHTPHGSTNPRMLKRNVVRFLCLDCHSNTPGIEGPTIAGAGTPVFHNLAFPLFQNCTACHVMIHGSNTNKDLLR